MSRTTTHRPLAALLVAGVSLSALSTHALAQAAPATADEEVVVTGTRIRQPNLTSATATVALDAKRLATIGELNLGDALRRLPQLGAQGLTTTNSNFLPQGQGLNTIDLRNLGADRTLVLVNGRRVVSGRPGTQNADLSMIPTALIKRVDVVTGGASAVYGSDALAGVVNIITDDAFDGVSLTAQGGWNDVYSTNHEVGLSLTAGSPFADGKGSAVFSLAYDDVGAAYARSRPETARDCLTLAPAGSALEQSCAPSAGSSFAEGGVFQLTNAGTFAVVTRVLDPAAPGGVRPLATTDYYQRQPHRLNEIPLERFSFSTALGYDVAPGHRLYAEGGYIQTEASSLAEPFGLSSQSVYGLTQQDGQRRGVVAGIPLTNPYIPAGLLAQANALGSNAIGFVVRTSEFGERLAEIERQTARFVLGAKGDIGAGWAYDASYSWGQTTESLFATGQMNVLNYRNALNAIVLDGVVVCADPAARAQGCTPFDPFNAVGAPGVLTQRQLDYLKADMTRDIEMEQEVFSAVVDGPIAELPAGSLAGVFGLEYRREHSSDRPDILSQRGLNGGNVTPVTEGGFDVYEMFGELHVPLLADQPWAKELSLHGAARLSDYSSIGQTFAWSSDLTWAVDDVIRLRAQFAHAVRAPNISELYRGPTESFALVADPCNQLRTAAGGGALPGGRTDPAVIANCLADPGIAARANSPTGFVLTTSEQQATGGFVSGNPLLRQETGETFTIGLVLTPADWGLDGVTFSVDYFNIKIKDAIASVTRNETLNLCYASAGLSSPYCANITRDMNGVLTAVNTGATNSRTMETDGLDVLASWRLDLGETFGLGDDYGALTLGVNYQYLNSFDVTTLPGTAYESVKSHVGLLGYFKHKAQLSALYEIGGFALNLDANVTSDAHNFNDPAVFRTPVKIPVQWFFDAQISYDVIDNATATFGVRNLTDEYVLIGQGRAEAPLGWATDPTSYDGLGRRFYAGLTVKY